MQCRDFMTRKLVTIKADTPLQEIIALLLEHQISGLPVVNDKGEVMGIVSDKDLLYKKKSATPISYVYNYGPYIDPETLAKEHEKVCGKIAQDIMSTDFTCVDENTKATEVASLMVREGAERVLVTQQGKLVGIVSKADILKDLMARKGGFDAVR